MEDIKLNLTNFSLPQLSPVTVQHKPNRITSTVWQTNEDFNGAISENIAKFESLEANKINTAMKIAMQIEIDRLTNENKQQNAKFQDEIVKKDRIIHMLATELAEVKDKYKALRKLAKGYAIQTSAIFGQLSQITKEVEPPSSGSNQHQREFINSNTLSTRI